MDNSINELKQAIADAESSIQNQKDAPCRQNEEALQLRDDIVAKMEEGLNYTKGKLLDAYLSNPHILKMINIAELQNFLLKRGFVFNRFPNSVEHTIDQLQYNYVVVTFPLEFVCLHNKLTGESFYYNYTDPELHSNVLSKITELIGE